MIYPTLILTIAFVALIFTSIALPPKKGACRRATIEAAGLGFWLGWIGATASGAIGG